MPRKKSPTLTEAELRLMDVIWERGESTVGDVVEALPKDSRLAYSSVLTTLRILEQKGYVRHEKRGRAFLYSPIPGREDAQRNSFHYLYCLHDPPSGHIGTRRGRRRLCTGHLHDDRSAVGIHRAHLQGRACNSPGHRCHRTGT